MREEIAPEGTDAYSGFLFDRRGVDAKIGEEGRVGFQPQRCTTYWKIKIKQNLTLILRDVRTVMFRDDS